MRLSRSACLRTAVVAGAITTVLSAPSAATGAQSWGTGLELSQAKVGFAGKVRLQGGFRHRVVQRAPAESADRSRTTTPSSEPVRRKAVGIEFKPFGRRGWRTIAQTRTGKAGRFKEKLKLRRSGKLRARLDDGTATGTRKVRVGSAFTVKVRSRHLDAGNPALVKGRVKPGTRDRKVKVKVGSASKKVRTTSRGRFRAKLPARGLGRHKVKVKVSGDRAAAGGRRKAGKITTYRRAFASWYGPGLYGNRTACGQTLGYDTVGVAHKTMPCGTKLTFRYGKRTVRTKVIDRGPFHPGREFDLTGALKRKLGFGSTGYVQVSR